MASTTTAAAGAPRRARSRAEDVAGLGGVRALLFVAPALTVIALFLLFPAVWTIYLGLTSYRLTGLAASSTDFVGVGNYLATLRDPAFWSSLRLTVLFVALSGVVGQSVMGFALAWSTRRIAGWARALLESVVLAAWVIPGSVVSFLWIALLDRRGGTLNALLHLPGKAWLIEHPLTVIIVFNIWCGTAFSMQLFSSALSAVPPSQLESARMAGASGWQQLRDVVLPTIRGHVLTNTLMITLWTFNTFTPYLLTAGGPGHRTEIMSVYIYKTAIPGGQLGRGAALSVLMLVVNLVIALAYMRVGRSRR